RLLRIGIALHPSLNRLAVLRAGKLQSDKGCDLRQHVLVQNGWPLGDHEGAEPLYATAPNDFIESPRQCAFVRHRILWGNLIRLIHYEMESGLVGRIEPFKERREKAPLLITRHLRHVDDGLHIALTKRLRKVLSTIGRDLDIGILSAENKNRKSAGHRTIPARAQSVPNPGWVYDDDAAPSRKKVFNRAL